MTLGQRLRRNQEVGLVYACECAQVYLCYGAGVMRTGCSATTPPSRPELEEEDALQWFLIKVLFHWFCFAFPALLPLTPSSPGQREYSPTPGGSPEESQLSGEMQRVEAGGGPLKTKVGLLHPVYQLSSKGQKAQRMLARLDSLMLRKGRGASWRT